MNEDEVDEEDDAEELPARMSVPPQSSKQRNRVGQSKREAALKSEVSSLLNSSFV